MRKLILLTYILLAGIASEAQIVEISANAGTSANPALGTSNYVANESIYTEAEIGAGNFTTAGTAMTRIGLNVNTVGTVTTFSNVKIYFKDVPLTTTTFTSGTYSTAGYTEVFSGSVTFAATGWTEFSLTTPYVRAAGTNLQMLIERTDNVAHPGFVWITANGNNTSSTINTTRRYNSTVALSATTSLTVSAFRQAVRFARRVNNDAGVAQVYTLGKIPLPNGVPHVISANVVNDGLTPLTNLNVTLNVTGANTFSNVQVIPSLASGASATVSFAAFSPTAEGTNNVSVSVPADGNNSNNSITISQSANKNTWSYAYGSTASGGVGFTGASGDFVAKFNTAAATALSQVTVNFFVGGQPYKIGVWDASGAGGTPGTLLWESASQTAAAGINVLPVSPAVSLPAGPFFVGVRQTGTTNVSFAYQAETPIRSSTFYFTSPTGGTTWTDFSPGNSFRFMIEPKLILPVDAAVSNISVPSTVTCQSSFETVTVRLNNTGTNAIAPGAASVTLKIRGANSFTGTASNFTSIASGGFETLSFPGINLTNGGQNFDTAYVTLAGDADKSNDTARVSYLSASTINIVTPKVEDAEGALPVVGYVTGVVNANAWAIQTGNYSNADQTNPLVPLSGNKFFIFDSYNASAGTTSRLFSNCIQVLSSNANNNCTPQLSFWMSHDNTGGTGLNSLDSLYISVTTNGGLTWTRLPGGYQRHDPSLTLNAAPVWRKETINLSAYAGQFIQIGFEGVSKFGNSFGLDDIVVGYDAQTNAALSGTADNGIALVKKCTSLGWTYYVNPADVNKTLFAVEWDPARTGANAAAMANAVPKIRLDATYFAAEDIPAKKATYTMRRYWDIDLNGSALTAPVNVRFFYDPAEKAAVDNAAAAFAAANSGTVETPLWFKTTTGAFAPTVAQVTPDAVLNAIQIFDVNRINAETLNGVLYAQFDGITSFSGGTYATGVGNNTPIPVELLSFNARRNGSSNVLAWATSQEVNSSRFVVQRSTDGSTFTDIGQVAAAGFSNTTRTYGFTDNVPVKGINHYRLRLVDADGKSRLSWTRQVRNDGLASIAVYPNPVKDQLTVSIDADVKANGALTITDLGGKILYTRTTNVLPGNNQLLVPVATLQRGAYLIKVQLSGDVVIRKFSKL